MILKVIAMMGRIQEEARQRSMFVRLVCKVVSKSGGSEAVNLPSKDHHAFFFDSMIGRDLVRGRVECLRSYCVVQ